MPRISLLFCLSSAQLQLDLTQELSLHEGVTVLPRDLAGGPGLEVETNDVAASIWNVRATVSMFDERATEVTDQERPR